MFYLVFYIIFLKVSLVKNQLFLFSKNFSLLKTNIFIKHKTYN